MKLVNRRICAWVPFSQVHEGVKVLNELFGVSKPSTVSDGRPVLRLIMNLTGSNSAQRHLEGGCATLPGITSWLTLVIDGNECIELFQLDMSSAFYLLPNLAFNLICNSRELGFEGDSENDLCALACAEIPMGWLNSVGIMQEISENLFKHGV